MSKKFNYYKDNVDYCWYDSSNVIYTECIDNENKPKTLKVVFSNGTQYQYNDVNVNDYLLLRESSSQGKSLNRLIKDKKYEYIKLENVDVSEINDRLELIKNGGFTVDNKDDGFEIRDNVEEVVFKLSNKLDDDTFDLVNDILKAVGIKTKNCINDGRN